MKHSIIRRAEALGGKVGDPRADTLVRRLASIEIPVPLYRAPTDTPWAAADQQEPIAGLRDYVEKHRALIAQDPDLFYGNLVKDYFCPTQELRSQIDYRTQLFTLFREGSSDFREWGNGEDFDRERVKNITGLSSPDFLFIGFSQGYPNYYFVCTEDADEDNPAVYSTDHEDYLASIDPRGSLDE
ncbi:Uncharacterised protein [Delftia tsuruhatensis]|uniref:hypothetical protein n=1 Tax=Delftia tsuruhatensis TaxID=180282 RepID=UPI001E6D5AB0|nr:hypothetical protein [Delftia tsuruhatensis]CAB5712357.1 Uncharacterised protein [Delftia tsuruhatensis]CAC9682069.1 Uncharacterised protein [Delftia tsuruhatensis]